MPIDPVSWRVHISCLGKASEVWWRGGLAASESQEERESNMQPSHRDARDECVTDVSRECWLSGGKAWSVHACTKLRGWSSREYGWLLLALLVLHHRITSLQLTHRPPQTAARRLTRNATTWISSGEIVLVFCAIKVRALV